MLPHPKLVILDLGEVRKCFNDFIGDAQIDADFNEAFSVPPPTPISNAWSLT
ncbi:hypothetical protein AWB81_07394 [Caballeronia arationis]|nr:hypothetical protein AWB81_07394 [Caballeronia arationis]